jgi:ABC-type uncharacterized transport system YnjBCD ATPase subunit
MTDRSIAVTELRKRYGTLVALDGLSLEVLGGKIVGILGPNGSGKTTTVSILSTALRPDGGTATVCGHDVVAEAATVRGLIGFAGQFTAVDPNLTGAENLILVGRLSRVARRDVRRRAEELLARFGLEDAGGRLVRTYSGGMRVNEPVPGVIQTAPAGETSRNATAGRSPPPGPQALRSGSFRSLEHATTGTAIGLRRPGGSLILRLERLSTSNGPDLRVCLPRVPASGELHACRTGFIDLGALKGNRGSQHYVIPAGTDLAAFKSAVTWCRGFVVGFGVAPLSP